MLVDAIKFEIRDFSTGNFEEYCVPSTIENYEMIARHRYTRDIHFEKIFDFQFEKECRFPAFMIHVPTEIELQIDPIDEMVGVY